jgi:hypothetical protein
MTFIGKAPRAFQITTRLVGLAFATYSLEAESWAPMILRQAHPESMRSFVPSSELHREADVVFSQRRRGRA